MCQQPVSKPGLLRKHLNGAVRINQLVAELAVVFHAFDGCVSA